MQDIHAQRILILEDEVKAARSEHKAMAAELARVRADASAAIERSWKGAAQLEARARKEEQEAVTVSTPMCKTNA